MYYTVKTLLETGKSISEVARELGIDRKTVRKIRDKVKDGVKVPAIKRRSILDPYRDLIIEYLNEEGLTGVLIHKRLVEEYNLDVTYNCVKKYVRKLRYLFHTKNGQSCKRDSRKLQTGIPDNCKK